VLFWAVSCASPFDAVGIVDGVGGARLRDSGGLSSDAPGEVTELEGAPWRVFPFCVELGKGSDGTFGDEIDSVEGVAWMSSVGLDLDGEK
jgi:hypothetical protein